MAYLNVTCDIPQGEIWETGYEGTVTITNSGTAACNSWTTTFSLPPGQAVTSSWDCTTSVSEQNYRVSNATWNGTITANGNTSYGFVVNNPKSGPVGLIGLQVFNDSGVPPAAPILNQVTNPGSSYTVTWTDSIGASSYILQQSASQGFSPETSYSVTGNSCPFTNQSSGTYYYRVAATNAYGSSAYSNVISVVVSPITLAAPVLNPVTNAGSYDYALSWNTVPNATSYNLIVSTSNSLSNYTTIYSGASASYSVINQPVGTYYYAVSAAASSLVSAFSNIVTVIVTQVPPQLKAFLEGYWESWSSDPIQSIIAMKVDIINVAFATFTAQSGNLSISGLDCSIQELGQLVTAAHTAGKKVKLSIGGATYALSPFLISTSAAQAMANAVASFVVINSLDGVDYDIEDYPAANLQIALLQYTRALLPNSIISYTAKTPASTTLPYTAVIEGARQYYSYTSIMAYDAYASYEYGPDIQALIAAGVPSAQICLGLMPGYDDLGKLTSLTDVVTASQYVLSQSLAGLMYWDMNRDLDNTTGLGASAVANTAYPIIHGA